MGARYKEPSAISNCENRPGEPAEFAASARPSGKQSAKNSSKKHEAPRNIPHPDRVRNSLIKIYEFIRTYAPKTNPKNNAGEYNIPAPPSVLLAT
jgi:hypothetical protein